MKDMDGQQVKAGDVLMEFGRGSWYSDGITRYSITLWEMPEYYDGHGLRYSIDGTKRLYAWAYVGRSVRISEKNTPEGFMFAFYHGMHDFYSMIERGRPEDVIMASEWELGNITQDKVNRYMSDKSFGESLHYVYNAFRDFMKRTVG